MAGLLGIDKVISNLSKAIEKIEGGTQAGVLTAALHERGEAQKLTPVDEGNLKNSAYVVSGSVTRQDASFKGDDSQKLAAGHNTSVSGSKSKVTTAKMPMAIIGFSAFYAVFVHEISKNYNTKAVSWQQRNMCGKSINTSSMNNQRMTAPCGNTPPQCIATVRHFIKINRTISTLNNNLRLMNFLQNTI